jgi:hypothetical protein
MMRPRISVSSGEITRLPRQKENKSSKSTKSAEEYRTGTAAEIYVNNQRNRPSDRWLQFSVVCSVSALRKTTSQPATQANTIHL